MRVATMPMLTTLDNPFDPFTQWDEWFFYDTYLGHHTCAYLARVARSSDELSEADQDLSIMQAIDEIIKLNVNGLYVKAYPRDSLEAQARVRR